MVRSIKNTASQSHITETGGAMCAEFDWPRDSSSTLPSPGDMSAWTVGAQLQLRAAGRGDSPFLEFHDGYTATYADALERSREVAAGLDLLGVAKGDTVALLMENRPEIVYAWFGANLLGAIEVAINPANRGMTLEHPLNNCAARVLIVEASLLPHVMAVSAGLKHLETVVVVDQEPVADPDAYPWRVVPYSMLLESGSIQTLPEVAFHDPGAIMYTSGTSGPAKGVLMSHAHMYMLGRHVADQLEVTDGDTYMICLPLFHANAQFMQLYVALQVGARVMIHRRFSATRWVQQLRDCGATVTSLLGVMAQFLYAQPRTEHDADNPVERLLCLPVPGPIAVDFEVRFGARCVEAYGSTEAGLPIFRPLGELIRPGSCGTVLSDWYDVILVDPETDLPVEIGEVGEILVRPRVSFTTFDSYFGMPEATVRAWRNLWYHTGDSARRDTEGYYYFVDRTSDRIRRRGENIASHDIEAVLNSHAAVAESAAVGVPAEEGEDEVKVFVVPASPGISPENLVDHCASQLPYFAVPRYIEIVPELPKTASGKLQKKQLRALGVTGAEWDRSARQFV
ncbi:AMP-binding protein [Rhodococcus koreensis]